METSSFSWGLPFPHTTYNPRPVARRWSRRDTETGHWEGESRRCGSARMTQTGYFCPQPLCFLPHPWGDHESLHISLCTPEGSEGWIGGGVHPPEYNRRDHLGSGARDTSPPFLPLAHSSYKTLGTGHGPEWSLPRGHLALLGMDGYECHLFWKSPGWNLLSLPSWVSPLVPP